MSDKTLEDLEQANPSLELTGQNGHALAIAGICRRKAREYGCSKEALEELQNEMLSGDYNQVLQTAMKYFDVT